MSVADKLQTIAENSPKVYEAGRKSQYDEFWDKYLEFAKKNEFGARLFAGRGWNDNTFNPPEKIDYVTNATEMFSYCNIKKKEKFELVDFGKMTNARAIFSYAYVEELPLIDVTNATDCSNLFYYCNYLKTIEKLKLKADGSSTMTNIVSSCPALENITIEGTIGENGFNAQQSTKLSKASIISIINALSSTTSGLTVTLSKKAVNTAFETESGKADGSTSQEWLEWRAKKTNWTISLL